MEFNNNHNQIISMKLSNLKLLFTFLISIATASYALEAEIPDPSNTFNIIFVSDEGVSDLITIDIKELNEIPPSDLPDLPDSTFDSNELSAEEIEYWRNYELFILSYEFIKNNLDTLLNTLSHRPPIQEEVEMQLERIGHEIVGGIFLRLAGYYDHPPEVGCWGEGEINEKVRITMINGILNIRNDVADSANLISRLHGNTNVHYIFKPTLGWAWDLLASTYVKLGGISQQSRDLARTWKAMIEEMGGVNGGGHIIHYAHSIGAADTYSARFLLEPEELKMISVTTFGSPLMIPNGCFYSTVNYASVRDGVALIGRIRALFEGEATVIFVGTHLGFPLIDHLLDNESYRSVIWALGQQFLSQYNNEQQDL
jgi:hypothetical protein